MAGKIEFVMIEGNMGPLSAPQVHKVLIVKELYEDCIINGENLSQFMPFHMMRDVSMVGTVEISGEVEKLADSYTTIH